MLKFVKKVDLERVVMIESDEGELKILDQFAAPDTTKPKKKDDEECQTKSESTE